MQMIANGSDSIGNFEVQIPGLCPNCNDRVEVSIQYRSGPAVDRALKALGIDPKTPSLILDVSKDIGVTCGCYAKFHRQIAHISNKALKKEVDKLKP
jgi:hypothetical protein